MVRYDLVTELRSYKGSGVYCQMTGCNAWSRDNIILCISRGLFWLLYREQSGSRQGQQQGSLRELMGIQQGGGSEETLNAGRTIDQCCLVKVTSNSATPWTSACQPPLSQQYGTGLPFLSPGDLLILGSNSSLLYLLHWHADSLSLSHQGSPVEQYLR